MPASAGNRSEHLKNYPEDFRTLPLLLRAYDKDDRRVITELIRDGEAELLTDKFFTNPDVSHIRLRDGEYGCSLRAKKVERVEK